MARIILRKMLFDPCVVKLDIGKIWETQTTEKNLKIPLLTGSWVKSNSTNHQSEILHFLIF